MKHNLKTTLIIMAMFLVAQFIGLYVTYAYTPEKILVLNETSGQLQTIENYSLPYGFNPPADVTPTVATTSIFIALIIAVCLMLLLIKIRAEIFLRFWFLFVITIGISLAVNAFVIEIPNSSFIALAVAIPLAILKVFKRDLIVHNATELLIYPGIASVFIPLLSIWSVVLLLLLISAYDIYAVWHAGFMQKMAKYQMEKVKVFSGFFIPYVSKKDKEMMKKMKESKSNKIKNKKVKVNVAILGGGDVVFPIILAGVVLQSLGLLQAILVSIGATIALAILLYKSEKGKFYPAMPFITAGCLVGLGIALLI